LREELLDWDFRCGLDLAFFFFPAARLFCERALLTFTEAERVDDEELFLFFLLLEVEDFRDREGLLEDDAMRVKGPLCVFLGWRPGAL